LATEFVCSCRHKYYWWESSLLLRNLLLVAVVYLGPALGVYIQAHIVLLIMIVSLVLHAYTRPFKERIIDNMEFVSIGNIDDIVVCFVHEKPFQKLLNHCQLLLWAGVILCCT